MPGRRCLVSSFAPGQREAERVQAVNSKQVSGKEAEQQISSHEANFRKRAELMRTPNKHTHTHTHP